VFAALAEEVIRRCRLLSAHTEAAEAITRTCLSAPMRFVHRDLEVWMRQLGMDVRVDAAGNLRGVYRGVAASRRTLYLGSHLDTVPDAGAFDGVLGVVWAIAVIASLDRARLPFAVEVVGFSDEEGVRFGVPFIGSRGLTGTIDDDLLSRPDSAGVTLRDALKAFGVDPGDVDDARATADAVGYLECHIEQGPVLEHAGLPLGVVEHIVGQSRAEVMFTGMAGHAGTTPMSLRRDALAGAAEWVLAVEQYARETVGLVATTGRIEAQPGALNVIAGTCRVGLDVRHADDDSRLAAVSGLRTRATETASRRALTCAWTGRLDQAAVALDRALTSRLKQAVAACGFPVHPMSSGAGHDAMVVASRMPAALLFVRSPGGISHHPDETVLVDDVAAAIAVGHALLTDLGARDV
jgi:allantoate deiminase